MLCSRATRGRFWGEFLGCSLSRSGANFDPGGFQTSDEAEEGIIRGPQYTSSPPKRKPAQNTQGADIERNYGWLRHRDRFTRCANRVTVPPLANAISLRKENPVGQLPAIRTQNVEGKRYGLTWGERFRGTRATRLYADCVTHRTVTVGISVV
jgi:hypothetical protein